MIDILAWHTGNYDIAIALTTVAILMLIAVCGVRGKISTWGEQRKRVAIKRRLDKSKPW